MGKKSRVKNRPGSGTPATRAGDEVGPRQPCPCGSGRRYKACHGSPDGPPPIFVHRPFEGLAGEADIVAMREFVPSATAPTTLTGEHADRPVQLCSLLPMAVPALTRADGTVWLALQVQHGFGDPSRDAAAVLLRALDAEPGEMVGLTDPPGDGPRLQDLLADQPLEVTVHAGFDWWVADAEDPSGAIRASLESANAAAAPSHRLTSVEGAYWTEVTSKEHLRWVMPHRDEDTLLSALARVHVAGRDGIAEGSRLVGMFRAHGLLVPVWDLPLEQEAPSLVEPVEALRALLDEALAEPRELTAEERRARSGLLSRQLTLR